MEKFILNCVALDESDIPVVDAFVNDFSVIELEGYEVSLNSVRVDDLVKETGENVLTALNIRYSDLITLESAKKTTTRLTAQSPISLWILRQEGQKDFKMSCPLCGQKIWVRDADVNKRGRCPNCKKAFNLPAQDKQIRSLLSLNESTSVCTVFEQSKLSVESAVRALLASVVGDIEPSYLGVEGLDGEALKQATLRVELQDE